MRCADKEEYLKTYDDNGKYIKKVIRSEVHRKELFHKEVAIWIINSSFQLLLEKRSAYKMLNPNRLSLCAGHVVEDEEVEETLIREVQEEIGLNLLDYNYEYLVMVKRKEPNNYCFSYHYLLFADINISKLSIQKDELSEVILMDYFKFKNLVKNNDSMVALVWNEAYQKVFRMVDLKIRQRKNNNGI